MDRDGDDEDWYDNDDELDDVEDAPCPECRWPVSAVTDKCPACGYWLTEDDRRAMGRDVGKPPWLIATAWVVLGVFLIPLIALVLAVLFVRRTAQ